MEKKMKRIPFDLELAKAIAKGEIKGKIVTRVGYDTREFIWDIKSDYPIACVVSEDGKNEYVETFMSNGKSICYEENNNDLFLEVPDEQELKPKFNLGDKVTIDGDTNTYTVIDISDEDGKFIYKIHWGESKEHELPEEALTIKEQEFKEGDVVVVTDAGGVHFAIMKKYGSVKNINLSVLTSSKGNIFESPIDYICDLNKVRIATKDEKQLLIDTLKKDNYDTAKKYLKRFFGIEVEPKFEPFDKVLVRDGNDSPWNISFFCRMLGTMYKCVNETFYQCIPYNEQTKHLLGTTEVWEK